MGGERDEPYDEEQDEAIENFFGVGGLNLDLDFDEVELSHEAQLRQQPEDQDSLESKKIEEELKKEVERQAEAALEKEKKRNREAAIEVQRQQVNQALKIIREKEEEKRKEAKSVADEPVASESIAPEPVVSEPIAAKTHRHIVPPRSFAEKIAEIAERKPELNFIAGVALSYAESYGSHQWHAAGHYYELGWGTSDGLCAIMMGALLLLDEESHHQKQNKLMGILNILSGLQLFLFTHQNLIKQIAFGGSTPLAGPAAALTTLIDWIGAGIALYHAEKNMKFEHWLEDTVAQVNYLEQRIGKPENKSKRVELEAKREELLADIGARTRVNLAQDKSVTQEKVKGILGRLRVDNIEGQPTKEDKTREGAIVVRLKKTRHEQRLNFIAKGFSFMGMALIAVAGFGFPPLMVAGLAIAGAVALYYFVKNSKKLLYSHEAEKPMEHPVTESQHSLFSTKKDLPGKDTELSSLRRPSS